MEDDEQVLLKSKIIENLEAFSYNKTRLKKIWKEVKKKWRK